MRALLVVDVDATIKIYFKRAPFYNALIRTWPNCCDKLLRKSQVCDC
jgi:hypothetical protein